MRSAGWNFNGIIPIGETRAVTSGMPVVARETIRDSRKKENWREFDFNIAWQQQYLI
jgi:hypothetical protein